MPQARVNNIKLHYEVTGQGEPLLFIHGLGSSGRDWAPQVSHFAADYQVVTVDLRGHGRSTKPSGAYSIKQFADDVAKVMHQLKIIPAHVIGVSLGGMVAFQLTIDAPALVRSLTIVNSGPEIVPRTWKEHVQVWQRLLLARVFSMQRMGQYIADRMFPKPEQEELRRGFVQLWAENDPRAYRASLRAAIGWSVTDRLKEIHSPVLVLTASDDYFPVELKRAYAALIPRAEVVVIPDTRHALPVEKPAKFNAALREFLQKSD